MSICHKMSVSIEGRDEQNPFARGSAERGAGVDVVLRAFAAQ